MGPRLAGLKPDGGSNRPDGSKVGDDMGDGGISTVDVKGASGRVR